MAKDSRGNLGSCSRFKGHFNIHHEHMVSLYMCIVEDQNSFAIVLTKNCNLLRWSKNNGLSDRMRDWER